MSEKTVIGGCFALESELSGTQYPPFASGLDQLLANGRSCIIAAAECVRPPVIWLPSYICSSVCAGLSGRTIQFYPVTENLSIESRDWIDRVQPQDLVVLVEYFGFPSNLEVVRLVKQRGAYALADACQALLSQNDRQLYDFVVFSPRKYFGVPDGGILRIQRQPEFRIPALKPSPTKWWLKAFNACLLRRDFDKGVGGREWFQLFQEAEAETPVGPFEMSSLSKAILFHSIDYERAAERRRQNFEYLCDRLTSFALFPSLDSDTVPLGFPIRVSNRVKVRQALFEKQIYPPVHWPIEGLLERFASARILSAEIMTLPCDQRYNLKHMAQMAEIVSAHTNSVTGASKRGH